MPYIVISTTIAVAVVGWMWNSRRQRNASRKQHTFNALLHVSFNNEYRESLVAARPYLTREKEYTGDEPDDELQTKITFLLNHFEFIAAGIRNGDIDEGLFRDSERGTMVCAFEAFEAHIYSVRSRRGREAIYEHIEWLYERWLRNPPGRIQRFKELCLGRPVYGKRAIIKT